MENKIIKAIQKINPNAEISVSGEDINQSFGKMEQHQYLKLT
jgi:hypothetical protein